MSARKNFFYNSIKELPITSEGLKKLNNFYKISINIDQTLKEKDDFVL